MLGRCREVSGIHAPVSAKPPLDRRLRLVQKTFCLSHVRAPTMTITTVFQYYCRHRLLRDEAHAYVRKSEQRCSANVLG